MHSYYFWQFSRHRLSSPLLQIVNNDLLNDSVVVFLQFYLHIFINTQSRLLNPQYLSHMRILSLLRSNQNLILHLTFLKRLNTQGLILDQALKSLNFAASLLTLIQLLLQHAHPLGKTIILAEFQL